MSSREDVDDEGEDDDGLLLLLLLTVVFVLFVTSSNLATCFENDSMLMGVKVVRSEMNLILFFIC